MGNKKGFLGEKGNKSTISVGGTIRVIQNTHKHRQTNYMYVYINI